MKGSVAQSGGAKEEKQSSYEIERLSDENMRQSDEIMQQLYPDDNQSNEKAQNVNRSNEKDQNTSQSNLITPIRSGLYVKAPLSKMGFNSKQRKTVSRKNKAVTRPDSRTTEPIARPDSRTSKPITRPDSRTSRPITKRNDDQRKTITRPKWVNYLI